MKSPFKFLDSYNKDDRDIFFGREREKEELYHRVFESKIMLVYGVSGTGKSSLIHCGLANKFQETDWLPLVIRKGTNILDSLSAGIRSASITSQTMEIKTGPQFKKAVRSLYLDHYKPVYFIFDQFEELFIFGNKEEKKSFIQIIKSLFESEIQCHFIFVMREEYMAAFTEFERFIPSIFQNRVRIEKMSHINALETIKGPCKVAGINLEDGFAEMLLEKLSPKSADVELTYLQVFLDRILRLAIPIEDKINFTTSLISQVGSVSNLLGQFLEEQIREFDDPDKGMALLKSFVSVQGTKLQMNEPKILDAAKAFGTEINEADLIKYLIKFVDLRILRERDESGHFELRHDALASKIYEKFTAIEKDIIEVRQFIENSWHNWQMRSVLLSSDDLNYISPYESRLYLSKEQSGLIEKSKNELVKIKRRRRNIAIMFSITLMVVFAGFTLWALRERNKAWAQSHRSKVLLLIAKARETNFSNPTKAIHYAQLAYNYDSTNALTNQALTDIFYASDTRPFYAVSMRHNGSVFTAIFSPDGKSILTASTDNTAKLWDLSGKCLLTLSGHSGPVRYAIFSPDGKSILTGSSDGTAKLWDLSGKCLVTFKGHSDLVFSGVFSQDGKSILTASYDNTAKLWDLTGKCLVTFSGHSNNVYSVAFSPNGKYILTASFDKTAKLWDLSGKCITTFSGHTDIVYRAIFSTNGKSILTASGDKTAKLWDLSGRCLTTFSGHSSLVYRAIFSPDGKSILTGSGDNTAKLWDLSGSCLHTFSGHISDVYRISFSPDGKSIITASGDNTAKLWNLSGKCLLTLSGHSKNIYSVVFSPDGKSILTGSYDNTAKLWDLSEKYIVTFLGHSSIVLSAAFSPDRKSIITGSADNTAKLWDLSGKCLLTLSGHSDYVHSTVFSPDSKSILTGSWDKTAKLWDLSGRCLTTFSGHSGKVFTAVFSPDGKSILTASGDNTAKLWDLSGKCLLTLSGHLETVRSAIFSPDGKSILTGSADNTAKLWDLSGKCLVTFIGHSSYVYSGFFSPDGKSILTASEDKTAKLWDLTGKCLVTFSGHSNNVGCAIFSPDGKSIFTVSGDMTAKLWDLSGKCLVTLSGHSAVIYGAVFSPDGKSLLIAIMDNTAKLWLTPSSIVRWLDTAKIGSLSPEDKSEIDELDAFTLIHRSGDLSVLTDYAYLYLSSHDTAKAISLFNRAIELNPMSIDKRIPGDILRKQNKKAEYLALYKDDPATILKDDISALQDTSSNNNYTGKFNFYSEIAKLNEQLLKVESGLDNKRTATMYYNEVGWYGLLAGKYNEALNAIQRGIELDSSYEFLYTNLPLCYLFNGQYEKAKSIYLQFAEKPWTATVGFKNYREVFLVDIADLEQRGITHRDFEKIKELLKKQ